MAPVLGQSAMSVKDQILNVLNSSVHALSLLDTLPQD